MGEEGGAKCPGEKQGAGLGVQLRRCSGEGQGAGLSFLGRGGQPLSYGALLPTCSSSAPPPPLPPPPLVLEQIGDIVEEVLVHRYTLKPHFI